MRGLRQLLSDRGDEDAGKREEGYPAQNIQRVNDPVDERERKDVRKGLMEYWNDGRKDLDDLENLP